MEWWNRTKAAYRALRYGGSDAGDDDVNSNIVLWPEKRRRRFKMLELYYLNTAYKDLLKELPELNRPKDFRSIEAQEAPAVQAVDFHVMHLFPGDLDEALPLEFDGPNAEAVKEASKTVLNWGNLEIRKRDYAEWASVYGEVFLKPMLSDDGERVYPDIRRPEEVTEYKQDSRGHINYARLDVDLGERKVGNRTIHEWWTEIWDKSTDTYRQWLHEKGPEATEIELGDPDDTAIISVEFAYDFVPLVKANFAGNMGVFEKFVEAIDGLNRQATKLRSRYFRYNKPDHIIQRNQQGKGAVKTKVTETVDERPGPKKLPDDPYESESENDTWVNLPDTATYHTAVPDVDYAEGLKQIDKSLDAIERVLAECRFFRGHDIGDPSAAAMRQHIAPAISRGVEARGNLENALVQAIQMCLTIGQVNGLFDNSLGDFKQRDGHMSFSKRELVPETPAEKSQRMTELAARFEVWERMGLLAWALEKEEGLSPDEAQEVAGMVKKHKEEAQQRALEQAQATSAPPGSASPGPPGNQGNTANRDRERGGRTRLRDLVPSRGGEQQGN